MSKTFAAVAALTFILASSAASAQMLKTADTPKGKTFVDTKGMTLYTFDKDAGMGTFNRARYSNPQFDAALKRSLAEFDDAKRITALRYEALPPEAVHWAKVGVLDTVGVETGRAALSEVMRRARSAGLLGGEPTAMAEHFAGLLWGNLMTGLLLRVAERPSAREIARRARAATAALLQLYPPAD